jgi:hypothetical protein
MTMENAVTLPPAFALWRRLDTPGHDAALLTGTTAGWSLRGTAVFEHDGGPACLSYLVELDPGWRTRRGSIEGFVSGRAVRALVERHAGGWTLDGAPVPGLGHLIDLDLGFTPATNLQQIRRAGLRVGESVDLPVAWIDVDLAAVVELPQRYKRIGPHEYAYDSPTVPYSATLEITPNGFALTYPRLWQAVTTG